jgi:glycosyltransferase involved in cell wall biosynthesis
MRLLVVSHVIHYWHNDALYAFGPYSREIDQWATLFTDVVIAAPCRNESAPGDCLRFRAGNVRIYRLPETGGNTFAAKARQLCLLPVLLLKLVRAMAAADVIHVRAPGNVGLLGSILAPVFRKFHIAKYAGQWNGYENEPWSNRLQRRLLNSSWWRNGVVTVYGNWAGMAPHVVSFFTSMMTEAQVTRAREVAQAKRFELPLQVLFVGRLEKVKRPELLLDAVEQACRRGADLRLTIIGDGSELPRLKAKVENSEILARRVTFTGALPFDSVMDRYSTGHVLVLPSSHSEGWPKVLAEAMCHGLVCIATRHGNIPWMLEGRGIVVPPEDSNAIAESLLRMQANEELWRTLSIAGREWACQYSLEGLREELRKLMQARGLKLAA